MITLTVTLPMSAEDWVLLQAYAPKDQVPVAPSPEPTPAPATPPAPEPKTHADLRDACRKARDRGVQLDAIRTAMGADKVDAVPADRLAAAVAAVEVLA